MSYFELYDTNGKKFEVGQTARTWDKDGKEWVGSIVLDNENYISLLTNYLIRIHPDNAHRYEIIDTNFDGAGVS